MQPRAVFRVQRVAILPQVPVIAIVEDDASVRTATQSLVRSLGFTAYAFACAEEFMQSPRVNDASCLIADVQMPGMSGVELQRVIIDQGRDTPMKAGAVCFLSKPVDGQTLVEYLNKALNRRN
jgi:FixJ family two-component response regulator